MIRINLLPHREQKKAAHRLRFQLLLGSAIGAALLVIGLSYFILDARASSQEERNQFLQAEISKLDQQIKDIGMLKKQRDDLLARKQLVERLQQGRNDAVHIFDQLVRQTPDGIYLKAFKQSGNTFSFSGYGLSGARVSNYMRTLAQSSVFNEPQLVEVKAALINNQRVSEFSLTSTFRQPAAAASAPHGQVAPQGAKP
ncbi:type IV pilus biogenesis protein PilN [Aquitalea magnusonii]|uniref:Type IV pilus biogenesis protein PilN n=1 Tax=Aquitalea magnusonii TaxID=332411 RepID=A0A3G9GR49_9NEIS|nr:PilN domain-containing protein [Aquitalea magnusonii]BBF87116.1 type IV pilus biogenesis protein PilN [Aquitalea magnusonii]